MRLLEGIMCKANDNALHAGDEEPHVFETTRGGSWSLEAVVPVSCPAEAWLGLSPVSSGCA